MKTKKIIENADEGIREVETQLSPLDLPKEAKTRIITKLKTDLILPRLNLSHGDNTVSVRRGIQEGSLIIMIGPRDWSFDADGSCNGAGTLLI